jgi:hypothetical protein
MSGKNIAETSQVRLPINYGYGKETTEKSLQDKSLQDKSLLQDKNHDLRPIHFQH